MLNIYRQNCDENFVTKPRTVDVEFRYQIKNSRSGISFFHGLEKVSSNKIVVFSTERSKKTNPNIQNQISIDSERICRQKASVQSTCSRVCFQARQNITLDSGARQNITLDLGNGTQVVRLTS